MRIKRVLEHTKHVVLACCERAITFIPVFPWRVTYGLRKSQLDKLQRIQNVAARLVKGVRKQDQDYTNSESSSLATR